MNSDCSRQRPLLVAGVALPAVLGAGLIAVADLVVGHAGQGHALHRVELEPQPHVLGVVVVEVVGAVAVPQAGRVAPFVEGLGDANTDVALVAEGPRHHRALGEQELARRVVALPAHRDLELSQRDLGHAGEVGDVEVLQGRDRADRLLDGEGVAVAVGHGGVLELQHLGRVDHHLVLDLPGQDLALEVNLGPPEAEGRGSRVGVVEHEPALEQKPGAEQTVVADREILGRRRGRRQLGAGGRCRGGRQRRLWRGGRRRRERRISAGRGGRISAGRGGRGWSRGGARGWSRGGGRRRGGRGALGESRSLGGQGRHTHEQGQAAETHGAFS